MNKALPIFVVSVVIANCYGADTESFRLGDTREQVVARFGAPLEFWAKEPDRHIPATEYDVAIDFWSLQEVYRRRFADNEFEIRLKFQSDYSQSQLHPAERLETAQFIVDRPIQYGDLLDRLPEAAMICAGGCGLYGNPNLPTSIWVIPDSSDGSVSALNLHLQFQIDTNHPRRKTLANWMAPVASFELVTTTSAKVIQPLPGKQWRSDRFASWTPSSSR